MTGTLGLAPIVATAVAALPIKRIFKPAGATFCELWKEKLDRSDPESGAREPAGESGAGEPAGS